LANHLLQLLALTAMEPRFFRRLRGFGGVKTGKVQVISINSAMSCRGDVGTIHVSRGSMGPGVIDGNTRNRRYRARQPGVEFQVITENLAAVKFTLRAGVGLECFIHPHWEGSLARNLWR